MREVFQDRPHEPLEYLWGVLPHVSIVCSKVARDEQHPTSQAALATREFGLQEPDGGDFGLAVKLDVILIGFRILDPVLVYAGLWRAHLDEDRSWADDPHASCDGPRSGSRTSGDGEEMLSEDEAPECVDGHVVLVSLDPLGCVLAASGPRVVEEHWARTSSLPPSKPSSRWRNSRAAPRVHRLEVVEIHGDEGEASSCVGVFSLAGGPDLGHGLICPGLGSREDVDFATGSVPREFARERDLGRMSRRLL